MYKSILDLKDTEIGIKYIKDNFENKLASVLNLIRVSAPLFVLSNSGLNDQLSGKEEPVKFKINNIEDNIEIVHSLAKWKRDALFKYKISSHDGIYADMNAIRKDEHMDNIHSIYVDQWDYEIVIDKKERNLKTLFSFVRKIYKVILFVEKKIHLIYPQLKNKLSDKITFISTKQLEKLYPNLSRKEREKQICKEKGSVFLYQIGWPLKDKLPHDLRAPDYDDWKLNGDIIVYNKVLDDAFELSSMGIRVDEDSIVKQAKSLNRDDYLENSFAKKIINKELPYTIGGGIGQSRLCMLYLEKKHIGEVQASIWSEEEKSKANKEGIVLL